MVSGMQKTATKCVSLGTIDENQINDAPCDATDVGEICLYKYSGSVESFESGDMGTFVWLRMEDLGKQC